MAFAFWFIVFLLGGIAQSLILANTLTWGLMLYLIAGVLCFLLFNFHGQDSQDFTNRPYEPQRRDIYFIPFGIGIVLFIVSLAFTTLGGQPSTAPSAKLTYALYFWLGFLALTLFSCGNLIVEFIRRQDSRFFITLALLLLVSLGLGLYRLTEVPPTVHGDEGMVGLHARKILQGDFHSFFSTAWYSIPQLFFFIPSVGLYLFGDNLFGLRISTVIVGTLTVIPFFILARRWWGMRAAILCTLMLIMNHWFIHLMHSGVNYVQAAFFATSVFCFWFFANQHRAYSLCILAGLIMGLSLMSYQANHLLPILWVASQGWLWLLRKIRFGWFMQSNLVVLATAFFVISPMLIYDYSLNGKLDMFTTRAESVMASSPAGLKHLQSVQAARNETGSVWKSQVQHALLATILYPDSSMQYAGRKPFLDPIAAVLFMLAVVVACFRFYDIRWSIPLWWILGILIAGGVMTVDPPFFPRLTGISTLLYLPIGGLLAGVLRMAPAKKYFETATLVLLSVLVIIAGALNFHHYFQTYAGQISPRNLHHAQTRLGEMMLERGPQSVYYIFPGGHFSSQSGTVMFLAKGYRALDVSSLTQIDIDQPAVIVVDPFRQDILQAIRQQWQHLKEDVKYSSLGDPLFVTFTQD